MLIMVLGVPFSILFALLVGLDALGTILVTFSLSLDILVWIIFCLLLCYLWIFWFFLHRLVGLCYF